MILGVPFSRARLCRFELVSYSPLALDRSHILKWYKTMFITLRLVGFNPMLTDVYRNIAHIYDWIAALRCATACEMAAFAALVSCSELTMTKSWVMPP